MATGLRKNTRFILNLCFALFLLCSFHQLQATHNRAGEITYAQTGPLTIIATITTYTKASSASADRDSLELFWGDGTSEFVQRSNPEGDPIPGLDLKVNYYTKEHTYPGRATYTIAFKDPNRVSGILNVNFPNSIDVEFYLQTTFTLLNTQFQGTNSSAQLLQPPIDFACVGKRFIHNPNAFDPDGDSLSYELVVPREDADIDVPNYLFPNQIAPGSDNNISLDPVTGTFIWESPQTAGEYNIAIRINEYRDGFLLTSIIRDMQIFVDLCDYNPPVIGVEEEICVIAGDKIEIQINVDDIDVDDLVILTATGGIFDLEENMAELSVTPQFMSVPFQATLSWQTQCKDISKYPYQVVFRAQDNSAGNNQGLADLKALRITVTAPPPTDLTATVQGDDVFLDWALPYDCELDSAFTGFSVWKRNGSNPFALDTCLGGLAGKGYEKIEFLTTENDNGRYFFLDKDVERENFLCYRVLAEFAQTTSSGNPFNRVESLASNEVCVQAFRDFPVLLNVTVDETDLNSGEIFIKWTKPKAEDLDTLINPGPYIYQLTRRDEGQTDFVEIPDARFTSDFFAVAVDSSYIDTGLNTEENEITYKVELYTEGNSNSVAKISKESASIFLNVEGSDQRCILDWSNNVSWQNYSFDILRLNALTMNYDSIGSSSSTSYIDFGLENGTNYCYKIKSRGTYGVADLEPLLINFSQKSCATAVDNIAPCSIDLSVANPCEELGEEDVASNILTWPNPLNICANSFDASSYIVYYAPTRNGEFTVLAEIDDIQTLSYVHLPTDGSVSCYRITVLDSLGNESMLSPIICVDNCPVYELPNTFTPNNDSANDLFKPLRRRYIDRINFQVFNKWGNLLYETSDPDINWDGTNQSGKNMDEGVYHYTCEVFEQEASGLEKRTQLLTGFIHLIRNN